jgi:hypothetical protein
VNSGVSIGNEIFFGINLDERSTMSPSSVAKFVCCATDTRSCVKGEGSDIFLWKPVHVFSMLHKAIRHLSNCVNRLIDVLLLRNFFQAAYMKYWQQTLVVASLMQRKTAYMSWNVRQS